MSQVNQQFTSTPTEETIPMSMQTRASAVSRRQAAAARRAERTHRVRSERYATRRELRDVVRGAR